MALSSPLRLYHQMEKPLLQVLEMKHYGSGMSSVRHVAPRYEFFIITKPHYLLYIHLSVNSYITNK